jgi:mannose-6-phosphate isomerase-like protein (cupin superfamily)
MRRVVTGEVDGRSVIVSDGSVPSQKYWDELWVTGPDEPLGHAADGQMLALEPAPGGTNWRLVAVPPKVSMAAPRVVDETVRGVADAEGFHKSQTVDYVYVLDGDLTLKLEESEVQLHPGDCVVQRATTHAWHNYNDGPVHILAVMIALP